MSAPFVRAGAPRSRGGAPCASLVSGRAPCSTWYFTWPLSASPLRTSKLPSVAWPPLRNHCTRVVNICGTWPGVAWCEGWSNTPVGVRIAAGSFSSSCPSGTRHVMSTPRWSTGGWPSPRGPERHQGPPVRTFFSIWLHNILYSPAWIEKNVPDFCATNSLVRKIPACLCQIQRLDSRQTEAGVARTLIARLKAAEFLLNSYRIPGFSRWVLTSTTFRRIASTCPLSLTTHRDPTRGLGRA